VLTVTHTDHTLGMNKTNTATAITWKTICAAILAQYPEVEYIGQVGWCGPDWQAAAILEQTLRAKEAK